MTFRIGCALAIVMAFVAGSADGETFPPLVDLTQQDQRSWSLLSVEETVLFAGWSVSSAGDLNRDGLDDVVIGTQRISDPGEEAYVVFGTTDGFAESIDLDQLDGTNGFVLFDSTVSGTGFKVTDAGDVNADGFSDLLIGAPASTFSGVAYVVFGTAGTYPSSIDLSTLDGSNGFVLTGAESFGQCGLSVSRAGDLDGDGIDDIAIGAPFTDEAVDQVGRAYVVFGSDTGFPAEVNLGTLNGSDGFTMTSEWFFGFLGHGLAAAGDLNGDGVDDLLVGAPGDNVNGRTYILFGSTADFPATIHMPNLDGTNGAILSGSEPGEFAGAHVALAGDVNADGHDDLLIGAPGLGRVGKAYVVFGRANGIPAAFDLSNLNGQNGFVLHGTDAQQETGDSVAALGDVNADGIDDFIIGTGSSGGVNMERGFVVFGSAEGFPASMELADLDGSNGFEIRGPEGLDYGTDVAGAGDVNGDGAPDILIGMTGVSPRGAAYVVLGRPSCAPGNVNAGVTGPTDVLFVNGSMGGSDRTVEVTSDRLVSMTVLKPITGGSGRFVVHADEGNIDDPASRFLPFNVGSTCFPFLLQDGATPLIISSNVGRKNLVGESQFFGIPTEDPEKATTTVFFGTLPLGLELTFQGAIIDPGAINPRNASVTNAVVVRIVP